MRADTGVESTAWVKDEKFTGKVPALPCKDVKAAEEEAKRHTNRPLEISM